MTKTVKIKDIKKLNLVLRENFTTQKLSAVPRIAWEIAQRAQKDYDVNIISNASRPKTVSYNPKIKFAYLPGSYFSFFDNVFSFLSDSSNKGLIFFLGSLSGSCVFSWKAKKYKNKIILNIINGGISFSDFKYLRPYDLLYQPSNCILHPSVSGKLVEQMLACQLKNENIEKIIVQSQRLKKRISDLSPDANIEQIPFGIPQNFLNMKPVSSKKTKTVLYFGHAYSVRGIDDMLQALDLLEKEGRDFRIKFIITPETNIKFLEKNIKIYPNLQPRTEIVKKYIKDLAGEIKKAKVCLFLYRFSGEIPEYPFALIEAMAVGTPVITTSVGAIKELFPTQESQTCLVNPGEIKNIKEKVKMFLNQNDLTPKIIKANQETVEKMTWDKYYNNVSKYF